MSEYERFPGGICYRCKKTKDEHTRDVQFEEWDCPVAPPSTDLSNVVIPRGFKSKCAAYDSFKKCKKCHVKKYVNRETGNCFACTGMP